MEEIGTLVIDSGSYFMRAGFAGDDYPRAVFPSIVGRPKKDDGTLKSLYVGDEALSKRRLLNITRVMDKRIVTNWDDMQKMWRHTFYNELRSLSEEQPVLLTEPTLNPKINREKMVEIMFEAFDVPALYVANQAVLALHMISRQTGLVLDIGDNIATATPIYEGHALPHAMTQLDIGGKDLTDYLVKMLHQRPEGCDSSYTYEVIHDIKEKLCFVAFDFDETTQYAAEGSTLEKSYELPNSLPLNVKNERFNCPEALFQPSLLGLEAGGVHELVNNAILKCPEEIRQELYGNIIVAGGSTMFEGFADRLEKEVRKLAPSIDTIKVVAPPERKYSTWIGGSMLGSNVVFKDLWIVKDEYNECGAKIVHRRCF